MLESGFDEVHDELTITDTVGDKEYVLFLRHYPTEDYATSRPLYEKKHREYLHLHGHIHTKYVRKGNLINVGVPVRDYEPKTLEELLAVPEIT